MFGITQRRLNSQQELEEALSAEIFVPSLVKDLGEPGSLEVSATFFGAVHFLAGYLERFEFKLFRNGGLPLIERHTGKMREELLIKVGSNGIRGAYVPITIDLHISHSGLREVRERYWAGSGRAPVAMYSANIGLIQSPPTFDIWNVATEDALQQITHYHRHDVLPFLELLASPNQMRRAIFDRELHQFNIATSLEWLLMEFGHADARQFIRQLMDQEELKVDAFWSQHDALKNQTQISIQPGETLHNLAVIALSHDLCRRWLY
jgi:hypothetical protein